MGHGIWEREREWEFFVLFFPRGRSCVVAPLNEGAREAGRKAFFFRKDQRREFEQISVIRIRIIVIIYM